jgi:hypothetical protein
MLLELEDALEHHIVLLWHQLKGVLVDYQKSTAQLKNKYQFLKIQDISLTQDLQHQLIRTQKLYVSYFVHIQFGIAYIIFMTYKKKKEVKLEPSI